MINKYLVSRYAGRRRRTAPRRTNKELWSRRIRLTHRYEIVTIETCRWNELAKGRSDRSIVQSAESSQMDHLESNDITFVMSAPCDMIKNALIRLNIKFINLGWRIWIRGRFISEEICFTYNIELYNHSHLR